MNDEKLCPLGNVATMDEIRVWSEIISRKLLGTGDLRERNKLCEDMCFLIEKAFHIGATAGEPYVPN